MLSKSNFFWNRYFGLIFDFVNNNGSNKKPINFHGLLNQPNCFQKNIVSGGCWVRWVRQFSIIYSFWNDPFETKFSISDGNWNWVGWFTIVRRWYWNKLLERISFWSFVLKIDTPFNQSHIIEVILYYSTCWISTYLFQ